MRFNLNWVFNDPSQLVFQSRLSLWGTREERRSEIKSKRLIEVSLAEPLPRRIDRWYRTGLLLIGDAAHPMSPVAGVGINYAIQDAVVAANLLDRPLKSGAVKVTDLAKVQRQRELPTRIIQGFQSIVQNRIVAQALATTDTDFKLPWLMRLPWFRYLPPRLIGLGVFPVRVRC